MAICANPGCNQEFPHRYIENGKLRLLYKRKFCFTCSPFKQRKGQRVWSKIKLQSENNGKTHCIFCSREYVYDRANRKGATRNTCNSCTTKNRHTKAKEEAVVYKGGSCKRCGYNKCINSLVFHHVKPEEKLFNISAGYNRKKEDVYKELDKCELLCLNCHGELHGGMTASD